MSLDLEFDDVRFAYGGDVVLDSVSLAVPHGEFLGIVGPNGSGKTTLLRLALGLLAPTRGAVRVFGAAPRAGRSRVGYCPQHGTFARRFPITVEDVVLTGRLGSGSVIGSYGGEDRRAAQAALASCEISALASKPLVHLSGGQLQRVMIARALACAPRMLLLDEPTANVDQRAENDLFRLLARLNADMTIIVVSHDIGFISQFVTRVACVNRTLACHRPEHLSGDIVDRLYGAHVHMIDHQHDTAYGHG